MKMKTCLKSIAAAAIAAFTFGFAPSAMASDPNEEGVQLWEDGPYWATTNLGADTPNDYGYFFQWGGTVGYKMKTYSEVWTGGKPHYDVSEWLSSTGETVTDAGNGPFQNGKDPGYNKNLAALKAAGIVDDNGILTANYDAAHAILGGTWRMPTAEEVQALQTKCTVSVKITNPLNAFMTITGKGAFASKSISFHLIYYAESKTGTSGKGYVDGCAPCRHWTASLGSDTTTMASSWDSSAGSTISTVSANRWWGFNIRPVRVPQAGNAITIDPAIEHGTVASKPEGVVKAGVEVALTVTPDADYERDTLTVYKTDDPTTKVTVTNDKFTMPDYAVTVTATFKHSTVEVQPQAGANTSVEGVYVGGSPVTPTAGKYMVDKGADVTVKFNANSGWYFDASGATQSTKSTTATSNPTVVAGDAATYAAISVASGIEHGTVTPSVTHATQGQTVTLTLVPELGYETDTVTAYKTGEPGTTVTVTDNQFTMPNYPVTVSATFKLSKTEMEVRPIKAENTTLGGVYVGGTEIKPTEGKYIVNRGAVVDVVFNANSTYYFQDGSDYVTSTTVKATVTSDPTLVQCPTPVQVVKVQPNPAEHTTLGGVSVGGTPVVPVSGKYWVARNATVDVTFNADTGYFFEDSGTFVSSKTVQATASSDPTVVAGPTPVLAVEVQPKPATNTTLGGVYVGGVEVEPVSGEYWVVKDATVDVVFNAKTGYYFQDGGTYVSSKTVTVTASNNPTEVQGPTPVKTYTIVMYYPATPQGGTVEADKYVAVPGDTVTLTVKPNEGYELQEGGFLLFDADVGGMPLGSPTKVSEGIYTFTMTAQNIKVQAPFGVATKRAITIASGIQHGTVTSDKSTAAKGTTVTLTVTPEVTSETAYELKTISVAGKTTTPVVTTVEKDKTYTFIMPAEAVTVSAEFKQIEKETLPLTDPSGNPISVTLNYTWVKSQTGETDPAKQAAALNVEEDNGQMKWENAILGLDGDDPTSIPVIAPIQLSNPGYIGFRLSGVNVDMTSGASVSNRVWRGSTPGGHDLGSSDIYSYEQSIDAPLPGSGVQYYNLEVLIK